MTRTYRKYNSLAWKNRFPEFYSSHGERVMKYRNEKARYRKTQELSRLQRRYYEIEVTEFVPHVIHKSLKAYVKGKPY